MKIIPEEEWDSLQDERRDYEDIEELKKVADDLEDIDKETGGMLSKSSVPDDKDESGNNVRSI